MGFFGGPRKQRLQNTCGKKKQRNWKLKDSKSNFATLASWEVIPPIKAIICSRKPTTIQVAGEPCFSCFFLGGDLKNGLI